MKPKVDKTTLQQFADSGKTLMDASIHFGVPYSSMPYWCKKHGVSFRGNAVPTGRPRKEDPVPVKPKGASGTLTDLYRQVVEIRQHMRRLAYRERQLLEAISKITDGKGEA